MTLRMLWPLWVLLAVFVPLLALTLWRVRASRGERRVDWIRRTAMVACVALIGLCPSIPRTEQEGLVSNAELYFVVDRTGSMAAEDYNGSEPRLSGVSQDMVALTQALPGSRYAIIGFDSQSTRQLPLTTDSRAVRAWAQTVRQEITAYSAGSAVDRPLQQLTETLQAAQERNPSNVRLVFFLSDGENTSGSGSDATDGFASFAELAPLVDGGAVLGYGTAQGGNMRSYDGTDNTGYGTDAPYIVDDSGAPAVSRIDETTLRTIADQLGVPYEHRIEPNDLTSLVADIDLESISDDGRRNLTTYTDVYWPFAVLLAVLLAWEAWDLSREVPKRRRGKGGSDVEQRDAKRASVDSLAGRGVT